MAQGERPSRREVTGGSAARSQAHGGFWTWFGRSADALQWFQALNPVLRWGVALLSVVGYLWGLRNYSVPLWTIVIPLAVYVAFKIGVNVGASAAAEELQTEGALAKVTSFLASENDAIQAIRDATTVDPEHREDILKSARTKMLAEITEMYPDGDIRCILLRVATDAAGQQHLLVASGCHPGHRSSKVVGKRIEITQETLEGACFLDTEAIYVREIEDEPRYHKLGDGKPASLVCAPVMVPTQGQDLGVLRVTAAAKDAFSDNDQRFIRSAALRLAELEFFINGP